MQIEKIVQKQRVFFRTGKTIPLSYRKIALKRLTRTIRDHEKDIYAALKADLNKSETEAYMCEIGMTLAELSYMLKHMSCWAQKEYKLTPLAQFSATSFTIKEPYGVVLIMSPWNYPFLLTMGPLIGAIAAGNCAVVKPSAYAPATSQVIRMILRECFDEEYVAVVEGGRMENQALLDQRFDYIFFTGGVAVGKEVMAKAARHLTPVTLELGGKSPCIVDKTAKLDLAAKRIVFGKLLNCGQTCVAPDYILCHSSVKDEFIAAVKAEIEKQFGKNPLENKNYGKIVNEKHFDRILGLIDPEKTVFGGKSDRETLRIEPTVLDNVTWGDPVMQEEIFGPVMPILTFAHREEIYPMLKNLPKPLAFYIFTEDKAFADELTEKLPFGGGCINDVVIHLATSEMAFGGVGESGMGSYHGKDGFEAFSHTKSIVDKKTWLDVPIRYQPYNEKLKKLISYFM